MIPRVLVPKGARPPAADVPTTRRRPSTLDERTLVPSTLPIVRLDGRSTIPTNLPLEAIATRMVVPRDINVEAVQRPDESTLPAQPTDMDERITIPQGVAPPEDLPELLPVSEDLVEPDIFQTGELSFLPPERATQKTAKEMVTTASSVAAHILLILFLIFEPKIFGPSTRTNEEEEIGRKQISVLLPPGALESLKPSAPLAPHPTVRVDPREIRKIAPPIEPPEPQPVSPKKELPNAPVPQPNAVAPTPAQGARGDLPRTPQKLESPDMPVPQSGLILPKTQSPGDTIRDAARATAGKMNTPAPIGRGGLYEGSGQGGGGSGRGRKGAGIELLTDTQGVDFNDYLLRVYYTVKRNWFAVMPPSVDLGERGKLALVFKIMRDGSVPDNDPQLFFGSGKEPLDRAAVSSIRSSNPFPQLPPAFKGPYIELRYTYCYNEPTCP